MFGKKGFKRTGVIEQYLNYPKLQRTGELLRKLKVRVRGRGRANAVELYNTAKHARIQNLGGYDPQMKQVKRPQTKGRADVAILGGHIHNRPFMFPSKRVLGASKKLLGAKMKSFGW